MSEFFGKQIAERLGGAAFERAAGGYKFAKIKAAKERARAEHPELALLDFGVGEPDQAADHKIVEVLVKEAGLAENRRYADNGILEFQEAAVAYLSAVYGISDLDPAKNVMHGIGSKPILAMLPLVFINPGDFLLTTVPGYPVMATHTRYLGGEVHELPLLAENNFYPNFAEIPSQVLKRAKLLYLNYPNNPTGQIATLEFYQQVIEFAKVHQIVVVCDSSYAALVYDEVTPLSFLQVAGASEVGVEIHSLSKAFNMTGWRLAFLAGNEMVIKAYGMVKDNTDSGQFRAIQKAGSYALHHPELTRDYCSKYSRRLELLITTLREVGFRVAKPKGGFYCYVPIPRGTKSGVIFASAEAVAEFLITKAQICTVPWDEAGAYLRFAVTYEAESEACELAVMSELRRRLLELELVF